MDVLRRCSLRLSYEQIKTELSGKNNGVAIGFNEAYYGRPERLLEDGVRLACSAWSFVSQETSRRYVDRLRRDLDNGTWDICYSALRTLPEFDGSLRLVISQPA